MKCHSSIAKSISICGHSSAIANDVIGLAKCKVCQEDRVVERMLKTEVQVSDRGDG